MKKLIYTILVVGSLIAPTVYAQYANCWQQYVCGGGGCKWVTICR